MQRTTMQIPALLAAAALIAASALIALAAATACSRHAFAADAGTRAEVGARAADAAATANADATGAGVADANAAAVADGAATPDPAADAEKHPIPTLGKAVSADGRTWSDACTAEAGRSVRYRLEATMADTVAKDEKAVYTVFDKPAKAIAIDLGSVTAKIVDAAGTVKAQLSPAVSQEGGLTVIALGDLKKATADLAADDRAIIEYAAVVSEDAYAGTYENVAFMGYDLGRGEAETVGVMASVLVPARTFPIGGTSTPKTGDPVSGWPFAMAAAVALAACVIAKAGLRRRHPSPRRRTR